MMIEMISDENKSNINDDDLTAKIYNATECQIGKQN